LEKTKSLKLTARINKDVKEKWHIDDTVSTASDVATGLNMIDQSLYPLDIMMTTCAYFKVSLEDILRKRTGDENIRRARLIAVYVIKQKASRRLNNRLMAKLMNRKSSSFVDQCVDGVEELLLHEGPDGQTARAIESINSCLVSLD